MSLYQKEQLYLAHHGIKGQKHGVRQVPWYPIDEYKKHLQSTGDKEGLKNLKKAQSKVNKINKIEKAYTDLQKRKEKDPHRDARSIATFVAADLGLILGTGGAYALNTPVFAGVFLGRKVSELYIDKTSEARVEKLVKELNDMGWDAVNTSQSMTGSNKRSLVKKG